MIDPFIAAGSGTLRTFDLSRPYEPNMPKSPNHPAYNHLLQRRHGDMVRADGGSAANDVIVLGTHVGTHVDALAHISHDGLLHGGADAMEEQKGGRFLQHGIDSFAPYVGRATLLDIPKLLGAESCEPGREIRATDLEVACAAQNVEIPPGTVILIRTGWGRHWGDAATYQGGEGGAPGVGVDAAQWLARKKPVAVGSDTIAFEHVPPGQGHSRLPVHRILLVDNGIHVIETMNLEELAAHGVHEFVLFLAPLNLVGATGAPVRPLAVVSDRAD